MLQFVLTTLGLLTLASVPDAVLQPGLEPKLLQALKPASGEIPDDWVLRRIEIPKDRVEAVYGPEVGEIPPCRSAPLCLVLTQPLGDDATTEPGLFFALAPLGQQIDRAPPLMKGVRQRLGVTFDTTPWKRLSGPPETAPVEAQVERSEAAFRDLLRGDPGLLDRLKRVEYTPQIATLHFMADEGAPLIAQLSHRPAHLSNPEETSMSFHIRLQGGVVSPADLPSRIVNAIRSNDRGAVLLEPTSTFETHTRTDLHVALFVLGFLLLAMLVVVTPFALRLSAQVIGSNRWIWALIFAAIILRLVVPGRLIELGIGVMLTDFAQHLIMPRYGPSVPALHHIMFLLFGVDHEVVLMTHRLMGCLMLPMSVAVALELFKAEERPSPWLAPVLVIGLGFTPMLVRAEATESNLQPALFAMWVAFLIWQRASGLLRPLGTLAGLGFAMLARPELVVLVPLAWLILLRPWRHRRDALIVGVVATALAPLQLLHVIQRTTWEVEASSLEFGAQFFRDHLWAHLAETALIEPRIAPVLTTLLGFASLLVVRQHRWTIGALLGGGLAWIAIYAVDLSSASAPRLHVAGLAAWTIAAAMAMTHLVDRKPRHAFGLGLLWLISAATTTPWLYAPTNEDQDQRLIERAVEALAREPGEPVLAVLHHTDMDEPDGHSTHRYFPTYKFPPKRVVPLSQMSRHLGDGDRGALYFQGVNCYASLDRDEHGGTGLVSACKSVHDQMNLEPVWVEKIPNHGNPRFQELGYYGPEEKLEVGLWRVRRP